MLLRIILESFKLHYFSETQVSCEGRYGRYDQINVKCPSVNLLSAHLQLLGLMNNMFINPEDLKSLVAHNNCDIRKSLLNLQFWSASHGVLKMPYKRPAHLNDSSGISDKNQTIQTSGHAGSPECVQTNSGVIFTRARVSHALLSLRKNGGLLVVYVLKVMRVFGTRKWLISN